MYFTRDIWHLIYFNIALASVAKNKERYRSISSRFNPKVGAVNFHSRGKVQAWQWRLLRDIVIRNIFGHHRLVQSRFKPILIPIVIESLTFLARQMQVDAQPVKKECYWRYYVLKRIVDVWFGNETSSAYYIPIYKTRKSIIDYRFIIDYQNVMLYPYTYNAFPFINKSEASIIVLTLHIFSKNNNKIIAVEKVKQH